MASPNGDNPEPGQEQPKEPTQQSQAQQDIAQDMSGLDKTIRMSGTCLKDPRYKDYEFEGVMRAHEDREHESTEDIAAEAVDLPPPPRLDAMARKYGVVHELPGGFYSKKVYTKDLCARIPGGWMIERLEAEKVHVRDSNGATTTSTPFSRTVESRIFGRFEAFVLSTTGKYRSNTRKNNCPYLILGIFSRADNVPAEIRVEIHSPAYLFTTLSWGIMRLRGLEFWFSLREVKQFRLYKCRWKNGQHIQVPLTLKSERSLYQLWRTYSEWWRSKDTGEQWTRWIHENINRGSNEPLDEDVEDHLSLEVVLGWSALRISAIVLMPVMLSLAIGLWFQWSNPKDLATIQAAWSIASYVVTASGCELSLSPEKSSWLTSVVFAALIAIVSSL
ncbi:hypothetical protein BKA58DRAFT_242624 [Alternaria rosae]|uniref:uncharacterized protein n=1 Tax=Alternaria rosae TaxID=1187941 RepID=UPI001E8E2BF8|nr:uncharacterized protein BKA58DRAFT_242624 [Alternaria rosae]KAH6865307.1 hypothetical protein BKA58DRAFT_242624 [Alternaria rosae]